MDTLRGVVERVTYHNEENGYTVAKLAPENAAAVGAVRGFGRNGEVAVVGNMPDINVGESVELRGRWTVHPEYGKQFLVEQMRTVLPATVAGMEKYLGSGLIKGVGPVTAKRIVRHFGVETLNVIEETPDRLHEVPGVGPKRVAMITRAWEEQRAIKEVMLFLQSHGVTTSLATKIYKYYGDDAIDIVRTDPYRLARDIFGIGFLTADKIARSLGIAADAPQRVAAGVAYALNQATDQGNVFLPAAELTQQAAELLGVSVEQARLGIVTLWNDDQVKVVDAPGSDDLPPPSETARAGDGIPQLIAEAGALYAASTMEQAQHLVQEEHAVYLTPFFFSEKGVAGRLLRIAHEGASRLAGFQQGRYNWDAALATLERTNGLALAAKQRQAVQAALTHRVTVLTGGPGTGKTTTVRSVLQLCEQAGKRVLLAAPTGRAAKRLAETTGREAKTVHRLLEFKPADGMTFARNEESPLDGALLIVDEASMLDVVLTNSLLKAVPPGMHVLFVGDVDQLPSVGAGNVLKDIIGAIEDSRLKIGHTDHAPSMRADWSPTQSSILNPDSFAVVRLDTIFRQAANSYIITNAHRINQGQMPVLDNQNAADFFLFRTDEPERGAQLCVELVTTRIPDKFGIAPAEIQVLSPMHRGVVGVGALNTALQEALNPAREGKPQRMIGSRAYRAGDKVMQIRNNYDKDVYNGDMGIITAVDTVMQHVAVEMDGRSVVYDFLELDELVHAYAISVHKSQGSEFPAVVIPVMTTHYMMLQRNLLYTAVTRAQRLVVLVGQPRALGIAVSNDKVAARYSGLRDRLVRTA
ncbi:MAG: AAA family ATPase [Caldilineaceae bacterium]|nr:AAA family ATPase [Caldilineaceae bacterium]